MQLTINGEPKEVKDVCTITELLQLLELGASRLAIELNNEIIPRSNFDSQTIQANDKIEIVQAIGGG